MEAGIRSDTLEQAISRNPHLYNHLVKYRNERQRTPNFVTVPDSSMKSLKEFDIIYPVGDPIFIHVYRIDGEQFYETIEPEMSMEESDFLEKVLELILQRAAEFPAPKNESELEKSIDILFSKVVSVGGSNKITGSRATVTQEFFPRLLYHLKRDVVGLGPIEPLIRDPNIEDISGIGPSDVFIVHKIFDTLKTSIVFGSMERLSTYSKRLSERIGRPVSDKVPIVDATLPDGSRLSIVYSSDVSIRGPSFTIRKFSDIPISIIQLVKYNTMSAEEAAYLWLALEYGQSVFVCGETASGKTTVVNALVPFIRPESKIFSAEDTPEIRCPQPAWQQLVTRERGAEESRVTLFDLLKTALRSRPNYIIVGEIRGAEGSMAFQAMQTGHPVIAPSP